MFSFQITVNGEDVTKYVCYPFSGELTLDRSLDQAYIELKASPRSKPYPPFSEVVVTPSVGEATTFVIASDDVDTIIKTGLSNHRILLCEETKKLERVICPGKTFVQPLVKKYQSFSTSPINPKNNSNGFFTLYQAWQLINDGSVATPQNEEAATNYNNEIPLWSNAKNIENLLTVGENFPTYSSIYENIITGVKSNYANVTESWAVVAVQTDSGIYYTRSSQSDTSVITPTISPYNVFYFLTLTATTAGGTTTTLNYCVRYDISVVSNTSLDPNNVLDKDLFITNVTNQLLEIAEPIRRGEPQRFTLDLETAARYATTPCAELNFPNGATLRENLDEIAGIVHSITRLKNGVIYFDKLGDPDHADNDALGEPVSVRSSANIEKYATHLDSLVDNLMNAQDPNQGAISDPFVGIFRTPRALISTTDARVTVTNCRIDTVFGIEKIEKVEVLYGGNAYDITAFVYEKKEYDLLETNGGVYPYAKAYALYYTQGQRGIDGLTFKREEATTNAFKNPAIGNILEVVTGQSLPWWEDAFADDILDYAFNVTYISAVRGRVRAAKKDISEELVPSAMAFNQSAPRLSTVNYGERLKGETAMLSEPETHLVFKTGDLSAVMESIGKVYVWDGERYYISKVSYKVWSGYIIAEMTLSRNFNQLGRFVSVNNSFRQFEIDDNSQEEMIVYEDYAVFSTNAPSDSGAASTSLQNGTALLNSIQARFRENELESNIEVTLAAVTTIDADDNPLGSFYLPVQSLALGNSLLFNFTFVDNYSAGDFLQNQGEYKLTRSAAYGDPLYGEAKYLGFSLVAGVVISNDPVTFGDSLPLARFGIRGSEIVRTGTKPLIVNKSSRDIINVTYQLHHVTDSGIVFGTALTQKNYLVSALDNRAAYMVLLPFEINPLSPPSPTFDQFEGSNDGQGGTVGQTTIIINGYSLRGYELDAPTITDGVMQIEKPSAAPTNDNSKAWAIYSRMGKYADNDGSNVDCEFLIGGNGSPPESVYVYLKHNLN